MAMDKEAFRRYDLEERKSDSFTVWINKDERIMLNRAKELLEQPKDSTAIKTLAKLGAKLLGDEKISMVLETVFKNKRNNKRIGISDFD